MQRRDGSANSINSLKGLNRGQNGQTPIIRSQTSQQYLNETIEEED
jgi:hypothetical protein